MDFGAPTPCRGRALLQDDVGIEKFTSRIVLGQRTGKRTHPLALIAAAGTSPKD